METIFEKFPELYCSVYARVSFLNCLIHEMKLSTQLVSCTFRIIKLFSPAHEFWQRLNINFNLGNGKSELANGNFPSGFSWSAAQSYVTLMKACF